MGSDVWFGGGGGGGAAAAFVARGVVGGVFVSRSLPRFLWERWAQGVDE